jgi:hypothetical protein
MAQHIHVNRVRIRLRGIPEPTARNALHGLSSAIAAELARRSPEPPGSGLTVIVPPGETSAAIRARIARAIGESLRATTGSGGQDGR